MTTNFKRRILLIEVEHKSFTIRIGTFKTNNPCERMYWWEVYKDNKIMAYTSMPINEENEALKEAKDSVNNYLEDD